MGGRRARLLFAFSSGLAVALPFLVVAFPPSVDLAQQTAQVRLFLDALATPDGPYAIQWGAPNRLSYLVLGLAWGASGPALAGRLALLAIALAWVGAVHALAARGERPMAAAVLASVLVFNQSLYWGFLGFLLAFPAFVLWLLAVGRGREARDGVGWKDLALIASASLLLYETHVLMVAPALVWLVAEGVLARRTVRAMAWRSLALLPLTLVVASWYPRLTRRFDAPTLWGPSPLRRLGSWAVDAAFGGLRGATETVFLILVVAWIAGGLWIWLRARRRDGGEAAEDGPQVGSRELLLAGLGFVLMALVLPERYTLTIRFASRWLPIGLALLLLAVPPPPLTARLRRGLAVGLLALFSLLTTVNWLAFERAELDGFAEAMTALPAEPSLLGLDYRRESTVIEGEPFFQMFAYGQVLHGGELNFSFADLATSLVTFRQPRMPGYSPATQHLDWLWTPGLEWFPERVREEDLEHFGFVLVHGDGGVQRRFVMNPRLDPVSTVGSWFLYRRR